MVIWGKNQYYLAFISNNVDADRWTVFVCELIVIVKPKYKEFSRLNLLARMRAGWLVGFFGFVYNMFLLIVVHLLSWYY